MKLCVLVAVLLVGAVAAFSSSSSPGLRQPIRFTAEEVDAAWSSWKQAQAKSYASKAEEVYRKRVFHSNMKRVAWLNKMEGDRTVYGHTEFMDLTLKEFRSAKLMTSFTPGNKQGAPVIPPTPVKAGGLPASFDWRNTKDVVTPVKNQGSCGSCWAFSTAETIESAWVLANNTQVLLSEQQLVDCVKADDGCGGGDPPDAYKYIISYGGEDSESSYPYTAETGSCHATTSGIAAKISSWGYVTQSEDEDVMQSTMYAKGPLSICVDALTWQFYHSGIIRHFCGTHLDHCVQLTGWSTTQEDGGFEYWIVRNSWGASWGESGYLYIEKGKDLCGIAKEATLPVV